MTTIEELEDDDDIISEIYDKIYEVNGDTIKIIELLVNPVAKNYKDNQMIIDSMNSMTELIKQQHKTMKMMAEKIREIVKVMGGK